MLNSATESLKAVSLPLFTGPCWSHTSTSTTCNHAIIPLDHSIQTILLYIFSPVNHGQWPKGRFISTLLSVPRRVLLLFICRQDIRRPPRWEERSRLRLIGFCSQTIAVEVVKVSVDINARSCESSHAMTICQLSSATSQTSWYSAGQPTISEGSRLSR